MTNSKVLALSLTSVAWTNAARFQCDSIQSEYQKGMCCESADDYRIESSELCPLYKGKLLNTSLKIEDDTRYYSSMRDHFYKIRSIPNLGPLLYGSYFPDNAVYNVEVTTEAEDNAKNREDDMISLTLGDLFGEPLDAEDPLNFLKYAEGGVLRRPNAGPEVTVLSTSIHLERPTNKYEDGPMKVYIHDKPHSTVAPCIVNLHGGGMYGSYPDVIWYETWAKELGSRYRTYAPDFRNLLLNRDASGVPQINKRNVEDMLIDVNLAVTTAKGDPFCSSVFVGGDSGGSRLSVYLQDHYVQQKKLDADFIQPIAGLLLYIPWVQSKVTNDLQASRYENGGYFAGMTQERITKFYDRYNYSATQSLAAHALEHGDPMDRSTWMTPTYMQIAEMDPNADSAKDLARRLSAAKNKFVTASISLGIGHTQWVLPKPDPALFHTQMNGIVGFIQAVTKYA